MVIAPCYSKALFEMGNCLTTLGKHEEARVRYEQAVRIDPALKELLEKRGGSIFDKNGDAPGKKI
jgi:tetratricopeptide (TPR) repeat protein